jgi:oligopeptide transport system permease protein
MTHEDSFFTDEDFLPLAREGLESEAPVRKSTSFAKDVWRSFRKSATAVTSLALLSILVFFVLFGPLMTKYDYFSNDYGAVNSPPSAAHWFGTDALGRDLWTRVWVGGRVSLLIALLATIIPYLIGMTIGGISGFFGGKIDQIIMRGIDILIGIPPLIYMILIIVILGSGNMMTLVLAMSITGWMGSARLTRGLVLQLKSREFVIASETLGASPFRLIFRHLLPNTLGILVVGMTLTMPSIIFYEAFLSYIGLGIKPPNPSWGQLIKIASEIFRYYPYQFVIPCLCVSVAMLCFNMIGDGLRDALDPRLRS